MALPAYWAGFDPRQALADYPIGDAFLAGPAQWSADELRAVQERRFQRVVARAWSVPFYERRWREAGLSPFDIQTLEDLPKIPPFSKADLMASIEALPPWGDYHGLDHNNPQSFFHTTSGTTGVPQPLFFGPRDREMQNLLLARAYRLQGLGDQDVVHSVYGFGMVNGGHYVREAVTHFTSALFLPAGTGRDLPSVQQLHLMQRFGATVLVGFVDYIKRLAEVAREQGLDPATDLGVRLIAGHLGNEDRAALSALWGGAECFDWYGVGDTGIIAAEGPAHDGLHLWEDAHLVEALDPETRAPVADGTPGNLCTTVLFKDGVYPIIRFDTQDVTTLLPPAGDINFRRMAGFQGRSDNMVKLRGINVYPTAIGAHLEGVAEATGEYVCRWTRDGAREELTVLVEVRGAGAGLDARLRGLLRERLGVEVAVELVAPGATAPLTEIEHRQKPIRLVDERG
ncbi:MAG: phenylacetate--CoA ligase family protein [Alphaproteobacteria bacterium]|nr:phenylacetate--CoA ligase family protein [Alphaproteobacteria bacterium]MCB9931122.1 phenylacetate--CoA ligase family protein [Alphaproteobacteria bacterium]